MRYFVLAFMFIVISGCGNSSNNQDTNQTDEFSVGSIRSNDIAYINIDAKFNSWLITLIGGERQEVLLKVKETLGIFNDPALWTLAVRTMPKPVGLINIEDIEVKLFSNYTQEEKCCVNTLPFDEFDVADYSYVAISGYINFESSKKATIDANFQQESFVGSGVYTGQIVNVVGCWNIGGEGGVSGCSL